MEWDGRIVDVWAHNLEDEMAQIRNIIDEYPYLSMDTEFPGVVARPVGTFKNNAEYNYQTLRCNVDLLKIIQLGITFADADGNLCPGKCTWQFNFRFSLSNDMYAQNSIDLLATSGVDFERHNKQGISLSHFGELLTVSGIVLNDEVHWITFHAGYDFAYILKILTFSPLPRHEAEFFELLGIYFPNLYDIKFMMKDTDTLKGGLQKIADELQVERVGRMHTAGSDSLLTHAAFFKMTQTYAGILPASYSGVLFGLGVGCVNGGTLQEQSPAYQGS